jgi:hypothetical protein
MSELRRIRGSEPLLSGELLREEYSSIGDKVFPKATLHFIRRAWHTFAALESVLKVLEGIGGCPPPFSAPVG